MIIFSFINLVISHKKKNINKNLLSYIQMISISIIYFRGFLYLEVFDSFRHLINMIIGVTKSIFTTLFVFAYILLAFTILFTKSRGEYTFYEALKINFNAIFGNLPEDGDDFMLDITVWVLVISIGIITTLILSNFLIAVMSSRYAELELEQTIISLKGKADMIEEIEIFLKAFDFFRKKKKKKYLRNFGNFEKKNQKNFLVIVTNDFGEKDSKINKIKKKSKRKEDKEILNKKIFEIENFLKIENEGKKKKIFENKKIVENLEIKLEETNLKIEDLKIQNESLKNFYKEKIINIENQNEINKNEMKKISEMIFEILEKKNNFSDFEKKMKLKFLRIIKKKMKMELIIN